MTQDSTNPGQSNAVVAYITIFGAIIAIFMNRETENAFARFHIRQAFGLHLSFFAIGYTLSYAGNLMATFAFWGCFFILWLYGFIGAIQQRKHLIPVIGKFFQKWFTFII